MDSKKLTGRSHGLFARKTIDAVAAEGEASNLNRTLGPFSLMALGIGLILGAGVFVLTGAAAAQFAGPAISLSFLIAAAGCALAALCYAELTAMMPASGSAYTYAYVTMGEIVAWIIGWNLVLEYVFAASYVAVGWSGYAGGLLASLGLGLPHALASSPVQVVDGQVSLTGGLVNLPAVGISALITAVAIRGIRISAIINSSIVVVKTITILLFIVFGALYVDPANWQPFVPENSGRFGEFGWSGVVRGASVVFVAYLGFDAIATTAQESRNPQRDMPIAIVGSLAICGLLYCLAAIVLTGLASYRGLNVPNPLAVALQNADGHLDWLVPLVNIGATIGLASVLLGIFLAQPRVLMAMSADGLLPKPLGVVDPRYRTPARATLLTGVAVCVLCGIFPIEFLSQVVSLGALSVFIAVCAGVLILRRSHPHLPRPFRVVAAPVVAPLGLLLCGYLLIGLPGESWMIYTAWTALGGLIYFFYGRRSARSREP
jgi:APA family basic amino acid/polyamine antiporter